MIATRRTEHGLQTSLLEREGTLQDQWRQAKAEVARLVEAVSYFERLEGKPGPQLPARIQGPLVERVKAALEAEDEPAFLEALERWRKAWDSVIDSVIEVEAAEGAKATKATKRRTRP